MKDPSISADFGRDRIAILAGLACVVAAGWIYLLHGAGMETGQMGMDPGMPDMPGMPGMTSDWTAGYTALVFVMWSVMMTAMMLPSAYLAIDAVARGACSARRSGVGAALVFAIGYLTVWIGFSLAATLLQQQLASRGLLSDAMAIRSSQAAALALIAIGVYQLVPLKRTCLEGCRRLAAHRPVDQHLSTGATFRLGMLYGISCAGCCATLMVVLFVAGVMNLAWAAVIALWVLAEKNLPRGQLLARLAGLHSQSHYREPQERSAVAPNPRR